MTGPFTSPYAMKHELLFGFFEPGDDDPVDMLMQAVNMAHETVTLDRNAARTLTNNNQKDIVVTRIDLDNHDIRYVAVMNDATFREGLIRACVYHGRFRNIVGNVWELDLDEFTVTEVVDLALAYAFGGDPHDGPLTSEEQLNGK